MFCYYPNEKLNDYKIMKLIDNLHELMEFIDDGFHNDEIAYLIKIGNELASSLKNDPV